MLAFYFQPIRFVRFDGNSVNRGRSGPEVVILAADQKKGGLRRKENDPHILTLRYLGHTLIIFCAHIAPFYI